MRRAHRARDRSGQQQADQRQGDAERDREPQSGDALFGRGAAVARADAARDCGRRAVGEEVEDPEHRVEDRAGDAEPAERMSSEVADDGGVGEHVQRLGGERAERRDREPQDLAVALARRPGLRTDALCRARLSAHGTTVSHPRATVSAVIVTPSLHFARTARLLGLAARAADLEVPAFRSPPQRRDARRTIRRLPGGTIVSV